MANGESPPAPLAALIGYQLDQHQFAQIVSLGESIKRQTEVLTRLAPPLILFRVTHKKSGFTVVGANLKMNIKNDEEVDVEVIFLNSQGGPAAPQANSVAWGAIAATGAFTVTQDTSNEKKALVKGNPQSPGGPEDIGVVTVDFDGDAGEGVLPRHGEGAVNVTPGNVETLEVKFGAPRPQTVITPPPPVEGGEVTI